MRLTAEEIDAIKAAARDVFGPDVVVRLFGSRVDDQRRGGDIDLHIEASERMATLEHEAQFRVRLWQDLDEPQVDVVVTAHDGPARWIDRAARREGLIL